MKDLNIEEETNMLNMMKGYYFKGDTKNVEFRIGQLKKLKQLIVKNEDKIIEALRQDLGRHKFESYVAEVGSVLSSISFIVKHLRKWLKAKKVKTPIHQFGAKSYIKPEPYGVVLIIGPFNYPFSLCIEPMIGAIAAGNCVVIKPSEQTPRVSKVIKDLIEENFSKEYLQVIEGGKEEITRLIHLPFDYIFFTGSVPVGKVIMEAASKNLIPVTLELGGKSPCIVDKDANIEVAAERIVWGKFLNAGQTCIAPDYLLVHESIKEKFINEFKNTIARFYGKEVSESKDFGRIVNEKHAKRLSVIIEADKEKVVFGGSYNIGERYIEPTLIDGVTWEDECMREEIFGPILPMMSFRDIDKAITMINERPKPLALYVFTENRYVQNKVLEGTSSGGSCINDTISHVASHYLPFGGVGHAGMGAYHGEASFTTFSHMKSVLNKSTKIKMKMIFPPYSDSSLNMIKKIMK